MAKVLIAEDDADLIEVLKRVLTRAEFTVLTAADGVQALAATIATVPDLVLSDVDMPRMGGIQLCGEIRANPLTAQIPVALLSGSLYRGDPRATAAQACRAWVKPLANAALVAGMRGLLAIGRHRHAGAVPCEPALAPA